MIKFLENIDTQITLFLNGLHCSALDFFLYHITHLYCSIPVYIAVILLFVVFQKKKSWRTILFAVLAVALTSIIVNNIIKPLVARPRPCNTEALQGLLLTVKNYAATNYSFPSSHAATGFAIAAFAMFSLRNKYVTFFVFLWAVLYSYSRIYLGVHFFGDVLCGAALGWLCAWLMHKTQNLCFK